MINRSFIILVLVCSHASLKRIRRNFNLKEPVNNCTIGYNNELPLADKKVQGEVSFYFNETKKIESKELCRYGKLTCLVKVKIALGNCNPQKATICEFNSIQISFENKTIDLKGSVLINTTKIDNTVNLETLDFTENSKYLTKLVPGTVKLVNCTLVMINASSTSKTVITSKIAPRTSTTKTMAHTTSTTTSTTPTTMTTKTTTSANTTTKTTKLSDTTNITTVSKTEPDKTKKEKPVTEPGKKKKT